jgi:hypothetical protein
MPSDTDLYFEWYEIHIRLKGRKARAYLSAENKPVYSQCEANYFDTEREAYRQIKRLPKGMGVFTVERIREYVPASPRPCHPLIKQYLDDIPLPYSLTAISWLEGDDVKNDPVRNSMPLSHSTYYRHRRKLLEFGIDIGRKCNVHLLWTRGITKP